MTQIRFYHLERQKPAQALAALLEKVMTLHPRILVQSSDETSLKKLSTALWSAKPNSFIPHDIAGSKHDKNQPILLTADQDNTNESEMLVLMGSADNDAIETFKLCCMMFDGTQQEELSHARASWKTYKEKGYALTYWQQGPKGWEQKAQENIAA